MLVIFLYYRDINIVVKWDQNYKTKTKVETEFLRLRPNSQFKTKILVLRAVETEIMTYKSKPRLKF